MFVGTNDVHPEPGDKPAAVIDQANRSPVLYLDERFGCVALRFAADDVEFVSDYLHQLSFAASDLAHRLIKQAGLTGPPDTHGDTHGGTYGGGS